MSDYTMLIGDALTMLRTLPDSSVHMCCTSPPYYALRDYGTATWEGGDPYRGAADCDHVERRGGHLAESAASTRGGAHKQADAQAMTYRSVCGKCGARRVDQQIGLEATPELFIANLVAVFREVRRVLHSTGQLFINIGDTRSDSREWLGIPHRLVFALQADGWRWEDEVLWAKPNPMPGSQTNRFTRSHEYVFMLNKSRDAFFDSEAVKEPNVGKFNDFPSHARIGNGTGRPRYDPNGQAAAPSGHVGANPAGRIKRTVWNIATEPTPMAHYAVMPTKLVEPCVLAGTSAHGCCSKCLAPWQRIVEKEMPPLRKVTTNGPIGGHGLLGGNRFDEPIKTTTTGWSPTCTCQAPVQPCVVLDPFAGSGTTLAVALKFGHRAIGIDLDPRNQRLVEDRIRTTQPLLFSL